MSRGKVPRGRLTWHRGDAVGLFLGDTRDGYPKPDGKYIFDKLGSVYISGNATRDDAPAASGSAASPPRSQLASFACTHALDPGSRAVAVDAVMRPVAGTRKLAIRFELLQRTAGASSESVQVGDLGRWRSPANPTL